MQENARKCKKTRKHENLFYLNCLNTNVKLLIHAFSA
jgi:hypothetical protein